MINLIFLNFKFNSKLFKLKSALKAKLISEQPLSSILQ